MRPRINGQQYDAIRLLYQTRIRPRAMREFLLRYRLQRPLDYSYWHFPASTPG